ncbi:hypothetical protein DID78_02795 [Candidatus Marinamargulisbacteria bacterium SCGC AG-343-D04]|nr:hypothetical protein DID78_02795 [Candidatus Marinamargulisbacteria bacterium SCGC AG-343-D04]
MKVLLFPFYKFCISFVVIFNVDNKIECNILGCFKLLLVISFSMMTLFEPVFADSLVSEKTFFNKLSGLANGLTAYFDEVDFYSQKTNINNTQDSLMILDVAFKTAANTGSNFGELLDLEEDDSHIEPAVINTPLVFPNPFRQSTFEGAVLSYELSKDFDMEIHIYNMLAQRVFKQTFLKGAVGARRGENRLEVNRESLGGIILSSGVYFIVFIHSGKVLSKGKMVVKP